MKAARPKKKAREAYHHGDLRSALSDAGIELLAEVGPDFTLRQVAKRVGVTHGAAYRHFADRDSLLAELAGRGFADLELRLRGAMQNAPDPRAKLEALLKAYVRFAWERRAQYDVMFGRRLNEQGAFPELEDAVQRAVDVLRTGVAEYLGKSEPKRDLDVTLGLFSLVHGFTTNVLRRRIRVRSLGAAQRYVVRVASPFLDGAREPGYPLA